MASKDNLLLFYERPLEPVFIPKGKNNVVFIVPYSYLPDRYKSIGMQLFDEFGDEAAEGIPVKEIRLPDLSEIMQLDRNAHFSLFIPLHQYLAGRLIDLFIAMRNVDELQSLAVYARDRINPYLFNYSFSVALIHRSDTQTLNVPSLIYSFPEKFIDSQVFVKAREEALIVPEELRIPIEIPAEYTASDLELEHRLWYFREDLGINLHHWHWHLVYPGFASYSIVNKNRRGELFYYMHQQILARYNTDRLCNKLSRVKRFIDWRDSIKEAYFPKLASPVASRTWPSRVHNERLQNLEREEEQLHQDVDDLELWKNRIMDAIHSGYVVDTNGNKIPLTENEGIDILANIVEPSILSPNLTFYGNLHNMGHNFISFVHDPDGRHLESFGVMADTATTMRDPIFYRWHGYIDYIFQTHKATLPRYTVFQLDYEGITVTDLNIQSANTPVNELNTFWQQSELDLSRGLDFQARGPLFVRFTHLQHQEFVYNIEVNNAGLERMGTCRIFLAPRFDEKEREWLFRDQKNLFIAMDRFTVNLRPGLNKITRKSTESTVTIPWEQTFRDVLEERPTSGDALVQANFCGCGWPQHMLLPKGNPEGYSCQVFVMISNYAEDRIIQVENELCSNADNYCGIKDRLYPDRRSMGYPFDRMPRSGAETLQQFLTPNMRVQSCTIRFVDSILRPKPQK